MTGSKLLFACIVTIALTGCSSAVRFSSEVNEGGSTGDASYVNSYRPLLTIEGMASYYSYEFNGEKTASGEIFNKNDLTAAHRQFPFGTVLRVTNLQNGKTVIVTVNDRGPERQDRILDLSEAAAQRIDMVKDGTARVKIEVLKWGKNLVK